MSVSLLNDISRNVQNIDLYERHVVRRIFLDFLILYCFCVFENFLFFILFLLVFQILYFVFQKYLQRSDFENIFQEDSRRRSSSSGVRLRIPIRRTKSSNLSFGRALVNRSAS